MTDRDRFPRRRRDVRTEALEDGLVAQSADGQKAHLLNRTAAFIWARCDGTSTVAAIAAELADETGEEPSRVRRDVAAAVDDLRVKGLVE